MKARRALLALVLFLGLCNLAPSCQEVTDEPGPGGGGIATVAPTAAPGGGTVAMDVTPDAPAPEPPEAYVGSWKLDAGDSKLFAAAEAQFEKKNYRRAAEAYEKFVAAEPEHRDVPRAKFKLATSRYHLREFDEALSVLQSFLQSRPGTLWEARTHVELGRLYPTLPSWGMRREGKVHYNQEHREGEYVQMWIEHRELNVTELEAARLCYLALHGLDNAKAGALPETDLLAETVNHEFELALAIRSQGQGLYDPPPPAKPLDPPEADEKYNPQWPGRKKTLFLYDEVPRLVGKANDRSPVGRACYEKALFLSTYAEAPTAEFLKAEAGRSQKHAEQYQGRPVPQYVPQVFDAGPDLDPIALLERNLKEFPDSSQTDLWFGFKARVLESRLRFEEAEALYEQFLERFEKSAYRDDVKMSLFGMRRKGFSVSGHPVVYPGQDKPLPITARNLDKIEFEAYRVDLHKVLSAGQNLRDPDKELNSIANFGKKLQQVKRYYLRNKRKRVASWTYDPQDPGDHRSTSGETKLELPGHGSFLVHARAGKVEHLFLVVHTDVIVVAKQDRAKVHYLVTDSASGKPLPGFPLLIKETYAVHDPRWHQEARHARVETDERGRATYKLLKRDNVSGNNVQVLAHGPDQRFAMTQRMYGMMWWSGIEPNQHKVFSYTDRPVYRPGHTVKFKHVVRLYKNGKNDNAPGVKCQVQVYDAKGAKLLDEKMTTDEFGSVHGEVELGEEAPLGVYRNTIYVSDARWGTYQSAGSQFRVEEYKKPEFKVEVKPSADVVRPGQKVKAEIRARYYFGAPVVGGKVKYSVFRTVYWHQHHRPSRYDWLYGAGYGIVHERRFQTGGGRELITEGKGSTDAEGKLVIELPPAEKDTKFDYQYAVQAEVTDLSRRLIKGEGFVKVTRDPFYLFLFTDQGFYSPNDRIELEINAVTPDSAPVEARGELIVERLTYPAAEKEQAEEVHRAELKCDVEGRAFLPWTAKRDGQYRFRVLAKNKGQGPEVKAERILNVVGEKFHGSRFRFSDLTMTTEKRTYLRGETIRLMIATPHTEATVWLTFEGGDEQFEEHLITMPEGSTVMEFQATETLSPNFFARAAVVHDHQTMVLDREIFIPPGEEILDVEVTATKAEYRPGEKGKFKVRVRDHLGQPLAAQLSLAVFDSSVLYIQRETAGDIRPYYYGKRRYLGLSRQHSGELSYYQLTLGADRTQVPRFDLGGLPSAYGGIHFLGASGVGFGGGGGYYRRTGLEADEDQRGSSGRVRRRASRMLAQTKAPMAAPVESASAVVTGAMDKLAFAEKRADMPAGGEGEAAGAPVKAREFFPDTALWEPTVTTGTDGEAEIEIEYPDSLTTWAVRSVVVDAGSRVGTAGTSVITTKNLVARLETPRFLVEGDEVSLAAVVTNRTDREVSVKLDVAVEGQALDLVGQKRTEVKVPAHRDLRFDFKAIARAAGEATLTLTARGGDESDALKKTVPILIYGSERMVAQGSVQRGAGEQTLSFDVPAARNPDQTELVVVAEPSMAGVLVQSLPYLIEYPYGCVEQTMSRFLPAVMVRKTLQDLGVKLEDMAKPPAEGTLAHPVSRHLTPWWVSPVYNDRKLDRIVRKGLKRLYDFQHGDGGWAWWRYGDSDPYISAYVVMGLTYARDADVRVDAGVLNRGVSYLDGVFKDRKKYPALALRAYLGYVLSLHGRVHPNELNDIYKGRDELSPYGKSLLALALHKAGDKARAEQVVENLVDLAWDDPENGTASFKMPQSGWWWWYYDRVETVSFALRAFLEIKPDDPKTERFARWLVLNRQGNRWHSTKDTAMAVYNLIGFMKSRGELDPDATLVVSVNGKEVKRVKITKKNLLKSEAVVLLSGQAVPTGKLTVSTRVEGKGTAYTAAFLSYFSKEKKIKASGNEIFVKREYYKLTPKKGQRKTWRGTITVRDYDKATIAEGDQVTSGDLIEVKLTVESKNDYEYLVFEDFKPAGCEPEELKSGGEYKHGAYANKELRDEKVVFFLNRLAQGTQVLSYRMHAQIPGLFHVLPHRGYAMYAPRVRATSDSREMTIVSE